jgi:hypothetical protein
MRISDATQQVFPKNPEGFDVKALKQDAAFDQASRLHKYEMELSRGASHIASMLYEKSMLLRSGKPFWRSRPRTEAAT